MALSWMVDSCLEIVSLRLAISWLLLMKVNVPNATPPIAKMARMIMMMRARELLWGFAGEDGRGC